MQRIIIERLKFVMSLLITELYGMVCFKNELRNSWDKRPGRIKLILNSEDSNAYSRPEVSSLLGDDIWGRVACL